MRHHLSWRQRLLPVAVTGALLTSLLPVSGASAATVPAGFVTAAYRFGLTGATALAPLPDGRLLVAEQGGRLRMVENDALRATPVLSVAVDSQGERGLIGVAAHPAFASNGQVFIHYTVPAAAGRAAHARIEQWRLPPGSDVATPASRRVVLDLPALSTSLTHNGGAIHFSSDGSLLIALGENGVPANSQVLTNPFGKVLKINPATGAAAAGNPYGGNSNQWARRIWAAGLRNPYTFAVARSGRVHINDVGQQTWEEINLGRPGANYGWPQSEGPDGLDGRTRPIEFYGHDEACSIAGGAFYEPGTVAFPAAYVGDYFYGDFCGGWVRRYDVATDSSTGFATGMGLVVDLTVATGGRLYVLSRTSLWRVDHPGP